MTTRRRPGLGRPQQNSFADHRQWQGEASSEQEQSIKEGFHLVGCEVPDLSNEELVMNQIAITSIKNAMASKAKSWSDAKHAKDDGMTMGEPQLANLPPAESRPVADSKVSADGVGVKLLADGNSLSMGDVDEQLRQAELGLAAAQATLRQSQAAMAEAQDLVQAAEAAARERNESARAELNTAVAAVQQLSQARLKEIASLQSPPAVAQRTIEMVHMLLTPAAPKHPPRWSLMRRQVVSDLVPGIIQQGAALELDEAPHALHAHQHH